MSKTNRFVSRNCCEKLVQTFNFSSGIAFYSLFKFIVTPWALEGKQNLIKLHAHSAPSYVSCTSFQRTHRKGNNNEKFPYKCQNKVIHYSSLRFNFRGGGKKESENGTDRGKDISPNIYWHTLTTIKGDDSVFPLRLYVGLRHELSNFAWPSLEECLLLLWNKNSIKLVENTLIFFWNS